MENRENQARVDVVRNFMTALDNNEQDQWGDYLADDFTCDGWTPEPLTKSAFLSVLAGLKEGMPGLIFNLHNVREEDDLVLANWQVVGYQTDIFELAALGLPPIPQTGRSVSLPDEDVAYTVIDRIVHLTVKPILDGGVRGILRQLGINVQFVQ